MPERRVSSDGRTAGDGSGAVATAMAEAATAWLDTLDAGQRRVARWTFPSDDERTRWFYTPTDHGGLSLRAMAPAQQQLAHRLLAAGLSPAGYVTATSIMALDNPLDASEGWRPGDARGRERTRDPELYYFRVFGSPDGLDGAPWGWRCGGHHLSVNVTLAGGAVVSTSPAFLGANPARVPLLGGHHLRPLAPLEDLARELMRSLDAAQRVQATLAPAAPPDIVGGNRPRLAVGSTPLPLSQLFREVGRPDAVTAPDRRRRAPDERAGWDPAMAAAVAFTSAPRGVSASSLPPAGRALLRRLLLAYVERLPDALAADAERRIAEELDTFGFAWAGPVDPGSPHYYRLQGGDVVVEYDNVQDGANHVHAVWREVERDFGAGPLAWHYAAGHH